MIAYDRQPPDAEIDPETYYGKRGAVHVQAGFSDPAGSAAPINSAFLLMIYI